MKTFSRCIAPPSFLATAIIPLLASEQPSYGERETMEHAQLGSTRAVSIRSVGQWGTTSHFLIAFVRIFVCLLITVTMVIEGTQQFAQMSEADPFAVYSGVFPHQRIRPASLEVQGWSC